MYYKYFGLARPPFKITPDTDVFFEGGNRGAILEALIYAISNGEGIIKVTGEVGSGKTMLCRVLQTRLPPNVETVYLANPSVSPEEILHAIAFELRLPVSKDAGRLEVMHALNEYLIERHGQQRQVVVFVEESQGMPISTLEEIRMLSNLETKEHKLLQIVLFGQPELDDNLRQQNIRQLRERITHSFSLAPLNTDDVRAYLTFRLRAAGYHGPDLFSRRVIAYMAKACGGLTRRLNLVADKALLAAFAQGTYNVTLQHVKSAVRDSEFSRVEPPRPNTTPVRYAVAGLAIGGALGIAVLAAYQALMAEDPATSEAVPPPSAQQPPAAPQTAPTAITPDLPAPPVTRASPDPSREPQPPEALARAVESAAGHRPAQELPSSATSAPGPAETSQADENVDLLEQRMQATEKWLLEQNDEAYSLQLLGANEHDLLREYLKTIAKFVEIEKVYVYRTSANGRPSLTVLYGTFGTRNEVWRALQGLPEALKINRPYYRTIQGIRSEIARQRS